MNKPRHQWFEFFYHDTIYPPTDCLNGVGWIEYVPGTSGVSAIVCVINFPGLCHDLQSLIDFSVITKLVECVLITSALNHVKLRQVALEGLDFLEIHLIYQSG